jgi:hypothetical protein
MHGRILLSGGRPVSVRSVSDEFARAGKIAPMEFAPTAEPVIDDHDRGAAGNERARGLEPGAARCTR